MKRAQASNETRENYLRAARAYCRRRFNELRHGDMAYCHESHAAARAMEDTEKLFTDLGTFGTEGDCKLNGEGHIDLLYLNTGDTYATTILFVGGRFRLQSWGDYVESVTA